MRCTGARVDLKFGGGLPHALSPSHHASSFVRYAPPQSFQNQLKRSERSSVYRTVCRMLRCARKCCSPRVSTPSLANLSRSHGAACAITSSARASSFREVGVPQFADFARAAAKDCALARLALARRHRRSRGGLHKIISGKSLPNAGQQSRACVTTVSEPAKVALHNSNRLPRIAKATAWLTCLAPSFFWAFLR